MDKDWVKAARLMANREPDYLIEALRARRPKHCVECGKDRADPPSKLCPGCQAYRDHTA